MEYKIYIITNTLNGKHYVGLTSRTITERVGEHFKNAHSGKSKLICKAIRKFGYRVFDYAMIDGSDYRKEAVELEKWWISKLNTFEEGYNDRSCQSGGPKLSKTKASEIKWLTKNNVSHSKISKKYGVSISTVSNISTGNTRKNLDSKPPENANDFFEESYEQTELK